MREQGGSRLLMLSAVKLLPQQHGQRMWTVATIRGKRRRQPWPDKASV